MEFLHKNMKAIRLRWGDTQEEFASRFGLKRSNYARMEVGDYAVAIETLMLLSEMSGISVNDLVRKDLAGGMIPKLPISGDGEQLAPNAQSPIANPEAGELWDLRALVEKVRDLDLMYRELDANAVRKVELMGLVAKLIERLEAGLDEKDFKAEKEAFIGRLAALLDEGGLK